MKKIALTGGSGKLGRVVARYLREKDFDVTNIDTARSPDGGKTRLADLTDFGQAIDLLDGHDGIVHLAAIPAPHIRGDVETFHINTLSTFNVMHAAKILGIKRVVTASSETTLGLSFSKTNPPKYLPIDEGHYAYPNYTYALSKVLGETMGDYYARTAGMTVVSLRFSNVMIETDYSNFAGWQNDPIKRVANVWAYIDARDAAQACERSLLADVSGHEPFVITSETSVMARPTMDVIKEVFPNVQLRRPIEGVQTAMVSDKAKRMLGYKPTHDWRG